MAQIIRLQKMNKTDLIEQVALQTKSTKSETARILNAILGVMGDAISRNEDVVLSDFGHFSKKRMAERRCTHPSTGELILVPSHDKVSFKPSENLCRYSGKYPIE